MINHKNSSSHRHWDSNVETEGPLLRAQQPEAMQLRYLQTMTQVAGDRASTVIFPLPMDLLQPLLARAAGRSPS
jgi:hypothetical protein